MKSFTLFLLLLFAILQGCSSSSQMWYKPGGTQREFDIDSKECEVIAEQQALERSETGKRYNPLDYAERYQHCIAARGWGTKPLNGDKNKKTSAQPSALGKLTGTTLTAFEREISLPPGSILQTTSQQAIGLTRIESFLFKDGRFFLNVILQDSDEASFENISYPVSDPYHLYTSNSKNDLHWSAFWGKTGNDWVEGLGSFLRLSRHQRVIIIVTAPLSPPVAAPPDGLLMAENQHREMQNFLEQWQPWLEEQSRPASPAWRALRATLSVFKSF